ncbi:MAG: exo-beta-N-acetylmuramidase NamZ family protein [Marinifilaceae bacterium]
MKRFFLLITFLQITVIYAQTSGIECWEDYKTLLDNKKVGVVANHTSMINNMHAVDFLLSKSVNVTKLYCPEHGFRGDADAGETIKDGKDARTGLPIISLYGKKKKPQLEDLKGVEVMIFDIQDVGVRFYTYISTLHYIMEACAEAGIPVVVMDRPNPHAHYVDGPVLQSNQRSFVGMHKVPIVYGMTIGEYANMINSEGWLANGIKNNLTVIQIRDWKRNDGYVLPVKPSPNLPDSIAIALYPSTCLFEGTVVSEGRGTYKPFVVFGHPDLKNMPYKFTPISIPGMSKQPKCENKECYGMDLTNDYADIKVANRIEIKWLIQAYKNYKGKLPFFTSFFNKLAGNSSLRQQIEQGMSESDIRADWQEEINNFMQIRAKYLLYQ